ncbi:MAG: hypothetical protein BWY49_01313 [Candidatus Omnitrophica bacterium ADurb.Bin314]|jgi:hypothetical protein|nr:MAG: hypothetical protein BWY49_01313 [Candidatus Omnitrophica bacterium ADurb.Bin314]HOE68106.1 hypothetical protein [Candidatus Omnitrophota bacterium]
MRNLKALAFGVIFTGSVALLSASLNYFVFCELQKRLEVRVTGRFVPAVFVTAFRVKNASFSWEDRVRVARGEIRIGYDPLTIFSEQGIRIVAENSGADIELLGRWAEQQGVGSAKLDYLHADITLGHRKVTAIHAIEARSPSFHFSIKNAVK